MRKSLLLKHEWQSMLGIRRLLLYLAMQSARRPPFDPTLDNKMASNMFTFMMATVCIHRFAVNAGTPLFLNESFDSPVAWMFSRPDHSGNVHSNGGLVTERA